MSTGGSEHVGGISASMELDIGDFDRQMAEAGKKLEETRAKLAALDAAMKAGTIGPQQYAKALADLRVEEQAVIASAGNLASALGRSASSTVSVQQGFAQAKTGGEAFGKTLLQIGYMADDMQYGFRGIANNIPQLFAAAGPAAMGTAAVVATVTNQVITHWDEIKSAYRDIFNIEPPDDHLAALDALTKHLEGLKKAAEDSVTAYAALRGEQKLLDQQQAATQAVKGIKPEPTAQEKATGEAVQKAIGPGGGGPAFRDQVVNAFRQANQLDQFDPATAKLQQQVMELRARRAALRKREDAGDLSVDLEIGDITNQLEGGFFRRNWGVGEPGLEAQMQTAIQAREKNASAGVEQLIADALAGKPAAVNQLQAIVQQQPGLFAPGLAGQFGQAGAAPTAEAQKTADENQRLEDQDIERDQRESARRVEADRRKARQAAAQQQRAEAADVEQRARQLAGGQLGTNLLSQAAVGEADVRTALTRAGMDPAQAHRAGAPVFSRFAEIMRADIEARALAEGIAPDQARAELLHERIQRAGKEDGVDEGGLAGMLRRMGLDGGAGRFGGLGGFGAPEMRPSEFVSPAQMAQQVQLAANQPDRSDRFLELIAEESQKQTGLLERMQNGVPARAV